METLEEAKWLASELEKYNENWWDTTKQAVGNVVSQIGNNVKSNLGMSGSTSQTAMNNANAKAAAANDNQNNTALINVANYISKFLKNQNKQNISQQKAANNAAIANEAYKANNVNTAGAK